MAKVQFNIRDVYRQEDRIVTTAFQNSRFLKTVERRITDGPARRRAAVAQSYLNGLIKTVKRVAGQGIAGASGYASSSYTPSRVRVSFETVGSRSSGTFYAPFDWLDLAKRTIDRKRNSDGKGTFYKHKGNLANAINAISAPQVTWYSKVLPNSVRSEGNKNTRIDFEISLGVKEMVFPLDEMVRRPFITGDYRVDKPAKAASAQLWKLAALEFGTESSGKHPGLEPRPWLVDLSAQLGEEMFDTLYTVR